MKLFIITEVVTGESKFVEMKQPMKKQKYWTNDSKFQKFKEDFGNVFL